MINFFKIFINVLYATFLMGIIALLAWGANFAVNTGGDTSDVPNLIKNEKDDIDNTIYFSDITAFNEVSLSHASGSHEIFFGDEKTGQEYILWGAVPVHWLNSGLTWTKNVFVAITSPSYEMEQLDRYRYGMFVTVGEYSGEYEAFDPTTPISLSNYENGNYDIYGFVFGSKEEPVQAGDIFTRTEIMNNGSWWIYKGTDIQDFAFKNVVAKYERYNSEDYDSYEKFLSNKTVVKWAFAEMIIIVAITIVVAYQTPIDFAKNEAGVTEINKSIFPKLPMPKRRRKRRYVDDGYYDDRKRRARKRPPRYEDDLD